MYVYTTWSLLLLCVCVCVLPKENRMMKSGTYRKRTADGESNALISDQSRASRSYMYAVFFDIARDGQMDVLLDKIPPSLN